jgi:hypothetical protein
MKLHHSILFICSMAPISGLKAQATVKYDLFDWAKTNRLEVLNRYLTPFDNKALRGIRFSEGKLDGIAWLNGVNFSDGMIELDVRGKNVAQKSFVGLAFHGEGEDTLDAVYLRPFNFNAKDSVHLSHCIQYISYPDYPWEKLRKDFSGQYEKTVNPAPDPDSWIHLRIVLAFPDVSVYLNDNPDPFLKVRQLNSRKTGKIGLFVGDSSDGDFANLVIHNK